MRKLLLFLGLMLFVSSAWAIPDSFVPVVETADAQVKATPGTVYEVHVAFVGVTIGDKIQIKNSTDSSGTAVYTCVAATANGECVPYTPPSGSIFTTAIYYDETKSGGTFTTTIKYF